MNDLLVIIGSNDQDRAACDTWWRNASDDFKIAVWDRIQTERADQVDEIVRRFAQLAFCEAAERNAKGT